MMHPDQPDDVGRLGKKVQETLQGLQRQTDDDTWEKKEPPRPSGSKFWKLREHFQHTQWAVSHALNPNHGELESMKKYGFEPAPADMPLEGCCRHWQAYLMEHAKAKVASCEPNLSEAINKMNKNNTSIQFYLNVIGCINERHNLGQESHMTIGELAFKCKMGFEWAREFGPD